MQSWNLLEICRKLIVQSWKRVEFTFTPLCEINPVQNHLEERLLDQAQAQVRALYTPLLGGCSRSIPQCMVSDV